MRLLVSKRGVFLHWPILYEVAPARRSVCAFGVVNCDNNRRGERGFQRDLFAWGCRPGQPPSNAKMRTPLTPFGPKVMPPYSHPRMAPPKYMLKEVHVQYSFAIILPFPYEPDRKSSHLSIRYFTKYEFHKSELRYSSFLCLMLPIRCSIESTSLLMVAYSMPSRTLLMAFTRVSFLKRSNSLMLCFW